MFEWIGKYVTRREAGRFVRFGITGALNTAVDFGLFYVLAHVLGVNVYLSQFLSYSAATVNSYIINKRWTFRQKDPYTEAEFARFVAVNVASLSASLLCLRVLHGSLRLQKMVAKLLTACVTVPINYLGSRFWVFERGKEAESRR
ncbi:MAG TPA: GtrA family protein [Firmicutes bacterium]|mgnify:CR=1 FL=1|nr:GtrA family protein [Candidatus Fermentithermobacillaceae bacterium]